MHPNDVGVVVNYFTNYSCDKERLALVSLTLTSVRLLQLSSVVKTILIVDGSKLPDQSMSQGCAELGVDYHHAGKEISYVDSYNHGWNMLNEPYILCMANDIVPYPISSIEKLREAFLDPTVGCAFPYLSSSRAKGDEVQQIGFHSRGNLSCEPSSMTLNLNLFRRDVLEQIGGLDPNYTASFAEPILLIKIRNLGYRAILVGNAVVHHLDAMTKSLGQSNIVSDSYKEDRRKWLVEYSDYASPRGLASINLSAYPFSLRFINKIYWKLLMLSPFRFRRRLISLGLWLEPRISRCP